MSNPKLEDWHERLSRPQFEIGAWEKDVEVVARDGRRLYVDVCRPKGEGKFPALLSYSPYGKAMQHLPAPIGRESDYTRGTGGHESGVTEYFVSRGYVHVHGDPGGIANSEGSYTHFGRQEHEDGYDIIEWIAAQPWCDGNVGMLGMSYFAVTQLLVAAQQPPHLKAIFVHDGYTDMYRHLAYHGGIFNFGFYHHIWRLFPTSTTQPMSLAKFSKEEYAARLKAIQDDYDVQTYPYLYKLTLNPENNPLMLDLMLHPFDGPFYWERSPRTVFDRIKVPVFLLSRWNAWAIHLPGALEAFAKLQSPRRMLITETPWEGGFGRPWYENHDWVLRWYDYWLKGIDNGVMEEPPIRIFVRGTNVWRDEWEWPLARTQWTQLYLRENGKLTSQPPLPHERPSRFTNEPWQAPGGVSPCVTFASEPMLEDTEVTGPIAFYFWASIDQPDCNWFVQLRDVAADGTRTIVSKGWLKASHRELDPEKSTPERPYHKHVRRLETKPGEVYEYAVDIRDTSWVFRRGHRIELMIKGQDSPWEDFPIWYHLNNMQETEHTVYHDAQHPSHLLLPIIPVQARR